MKKCPKCGKMHSGPCKAKSEWWDDEAPYEPTSVSSGSVYALDSESASAPGFYLPNGRWHALPKRRMGF